MSSPNESISDFDDAASTKKRVRDQSVDPEEPAKEKLVETQTAAEMSAPKKTKHEGVPTSVRTIRRNLQDMSTTDKPDQDNDEDHHQTPLETPDGSDTDDAAMESHTQEADSQQSQKQNHDSSHSNEKQMTDANDQTKSVLAKFGGGSGNDDWSEFAEDEEEDSSSAEKNDKLKTVEEKPKYTFGASSGFGMKGWSALSTQSTLPSTGPASQKKHTFGGFGTSSATPSASSTNSFPSFASSAATSPFALAAAKSGSENALSSMTKITTPATSSAEDAIPGASPSDNDEQSEASEALDKSEETSLSREKTKAKALPQAEVKTGEEDEQTIYHIKAKLFVMDRSNGNWKERGAGTLRINIRENASGKHARIVMRADTVYRVILNLPLFEGMHFLIMQEKFVRFAGFETVETDGKPETQVINYALKVANPSTAVELQQQLNACVSN